MIGKTIFKKDIKFNYIYKSLFYLLITLFIIQISISIGQIQIPLNISFKIVINEIFNKNIFHVSFENMNLYKDIIFNIRLPRVLTSIVAGMGLSLCGIVMQSSVKNSLADPYILGISSGASLGATFSIFLSSIIGINLGFYSISIFAFTGALLSGIIVMAIANTGSNISSVKLVLGGTIVSAISTSISNLIIYLGSNTEGIKSITFWTMGSLADSSWKSFYIIGIVVIIASIFFICQWRVLNTMLMGEEVGATLGVNVNLYRKIYLGISIFLTAIIVSNCGIIGFVGLTIPHITRGIVGSDHKKLLPVGLVFGGIFLNIADILARVIIPNGELPIGIITSIIGGPLFIYILIKKNYGFGGK